MKDRARKIAEYRRSQPIAELERKAKKANSRAYTVKHVHRTSTEQFDLDWAKAYEGTKYIGEHA